MLDDLAWLYIEPIVYKLEIPIRPALEDVRMDYAEAFLQESISCHGRNG